MAGHRRTWLVLCSLVLQVQFHAYALNVTAPTEGETLDVSKAFAIKWTKESGDPAKISIDLVNVTDLNPIPVLANIARNITTSSGVVEVNWPFSLPNDTLAYQLYFLSYTSGEDIDNSAHFNLTLPAGEHRTYTGAGGPVNAPSPEATVSSDEKHGHKLSGGAIAGIVVGCLAAVAILVGAALCLLLRRRRKRKQLEFDQGKPELDGSATSSYPKEKRDTITSSELNSDDIQEADGYQKDYLRYELPGTPPPAELEGNDIAAMEMESPDPGKLGDWSMPESPQSVRSGSRRPDSVTSGATSMRSGSPTLGGREMNKMSFAEALQEIVSQELRRK